MRKLWHFGKMCQQKQITAFHQALLIFNFLTQMYTRMVARPPRIGVGPGFDSQGSVTFFHKYCFPNLHWIHWANPWWSDSAIYSNFQVHWIVLVMAFRKYVLCMFNLVQGKLGESKRARVIHHLGNLDMEVPACPYCIFKTCLKESANNIVLLCWK